MFSIGSTANSGLRIGAQLNDLKTLVPIGSINDDSARSVPQNTTYMSLGGIVDQTNKGAPLVQKSESPTSSSQTSPKLCIVDILPKLLLGLKRERPNHTGLPKLKGQLRDQQKTVLENMNVHDRRTRISLLDQSARSSDAVYAGT